MYNFSMFLLIYVENILSNLKAGKKIIQNELSR